MAETKKSDSEVKPMEAQREHQPGREPENRAVAPEKKDAPDKPKDRE